VRPRDAAVVATAAVCARRSERNWVSSGLARPRNADPLPLLTVDHLRVTLATPRGPADALRDVSFTLDRGQTLGLIGESGCGKSITALALMGLLPEGAAVAGSIRFEGRELLGQTEDDWCGLRGDRLAMVFQEPMTALNPLHTIGRQIAEPLRLHKRLDAAAARAEALRLLERVRAAAGGAAPGRLPAPALRRPAPARRDRDRAGLRPDLLIADEPTTALDVTIQREVLELIAQLVAEDGMALLLISHDLGVMAETVQRMLVMYGGSVVESGPTAVDLRAPRPPLHARPVRGAAAAGAAARRARGDDRRPRARTRRPAPGLPVRRALRARRRRLPRRDAAAVAVAPQHWARCLRPYLETQ
jgi:peptide/nickel transport system ATP-binding protein